MPYPICPNVLYLSIHNCFINIDTKIRILLSIDTQNSKKINNASKHEGFVIRHGLQISYGKVIGYVIQFSTLVCVELKKVCNVGLIVNFHK